MWCVLVKNMECGSAITLMFKWIVHKSFDSLCYDSSQKHDNGFCISMLAKLNKQQGYLFSSSYVVCHTVWLYRRIIDRGQYKLKWIEVNTSIYKVGV